MRWGGGKGWTSAVRNSAEMLLIVRDFAVLDDRRFLWVAKIAISRYHERVAWLGGLPSLPQVRRSPGLRTTSFAISVHHFSMSAESARASRSILATILRTLALQLFPLQDCRFREALREELPALSMGLWVAHVEHASEAFVD